MLNVRLDSSWSDVTRNRVGAFDVVACVAAFERFFQQLGREIKIKTTFGKKGWIATFKYEPQTEVMLFASLRVFFDHVVAISITDIVQY